MRGTKRLKHLITLVKNEMAHILQGKILVTGKSKDSSWSANYNMRALIFQYILVLGYVHSTVEHCNPYVR
jgi:hypothetical protein